MEDKIKCNQCQKLFIDSTALAEHKRSAHPAMLKDSDLEDQAKRTIWEYLTSDGQDRGLRDRAKLAQSHRATEAKNRQSDSAREAMLVMMGRELAESKEQFREYMRVAMPSSPMLKALPAKGKN